MTEFSDPAIWITGFMYVQVGYDYVMVFRNGPNGRFVFYEASMNADDVIAKMKMAIEEDN